MSTKGGKTAIAGGRKAATGCGKNRFQTTSRGNGRHAIFSCPCLLNAVFVEFCQRRRKTISTIDLACRKVVKCGQYQRGGQRWKDRVRSSRGASKRSHARSGDMTTSFTAWRQDMRARGRSRAAYPVSSRSVRSWRSPFRRLFTTRSSKDEVAEKTQKRNFCD